MIIWLTVDLVAVLIGSGIALTVLGILIYAGNRDESAR